LRVALRWLPMRPAIPPSQWMAATTNRVIDLLTRSNEPRAAMIKCRDETTLGSYSDRRSCLS
jgi:hypothetical protein